MAFVKLHLPCPSCPSSDALCVDDNGRAYCFSCGTFFSEQEYSRMDNDSKMAEPMSLIDNNQTNEPINQSTNQSIKQPANQPINQPLNESTSQSA